MKRYLGLSRGRLAAALAIVMVLGLAGCGGDTAGTAAKTEGSATKAAAPAGPAAKGGSKKGQQLAPGGDMGVRERRDQKLKDRAAAKQ
jgi:hypothetical protein